eukprot:150280_1
MFANPKPAGLIRRIRGLHNFIEDINNAVTPFEERERINEELVKIEHAFNQSDTDIYCNIKYMWKLLFISFLGYDVKKSIGFETCLHFIQSTSLGEISIGYLGIVLFSSFPHHHITANTLFIKTLKTHLLLPITNQNHSIYKRYALRCIANLCHISLDFSNQFIEIVANICFNDDTLQNDNYEIITKSAMALQRLVSVNYDYLSKMKQHNSSIRTLLMHDNIGVLNAALCLFDTMLSKQCIVRQKRIELITARYIRQTQELVQGDNTSYPMMNYVPAHVNDLCCLYYDGPPGDFEELLSVIIDQLHGLPTKDYKDLRLGSSRYMYSVLQPAPWTKLKLLRILQYFDPSIITDNELKTMCECLRLLMKNCVGISVNNFNTNHIQLALFRESVLCATHYWDTIKRTNPRATWWDLTNTMQNRFNRCHAYANGKYVILQCWNKMMIASKKHNDLDTFEQFEARHSINTLFEDVNNEIDPIIKTEAFYVMLNIVKIHSDRVVSYFEIMYKYMQTQGVAHKTRKVAMKDLIQTMIHLVSSSAHSKVLSFKWKSTQSIISISVYVRIMSKDPDRMIFFVIAVSMLSLIEPYDLLSPQQMNTITKIICNAGDAVHLFAASKLFLMVRENPMHICKHLKLIELAAHILLRFGHLLRDRFGIDIATQFECLNIHAVAMDSEELRQLYHEFVVKYPSCITSDMITRANVQKMKPEYVHAEEREETKTDSDEVLSLLINDPKGNHITMLRDIKPSDNIATLKNKISEMIAYQPDTQTLYIKDTKLEANETDDLTRYGIQDGETLQLIIRTDEDNNNNRQPRAHHMICGYIGRKLLQMWNNISCTRVFCLLFWILVVVLFGAGVDIAAMIVASEERNNHNPCTSDELMMNPSTFVLIGGITGFITLFLTCSSVNASDEERIYQIGDEYIDRLLHAAYGFVCFVLIIHLFISIWCVIGFIEYIQLSANNNCNKSMIGQIILAWSIIKLISSFCWFGWIYNSVWQRNRMTVECIIYMTVRILRGFRDSVRECICSCDLGIGRNNIRRIVERYRSLIVCVAYSACVVFGHFVVDIAALIVAFSSDDNDRTSPLFMDPIVFLQIAGFFGLFNVMRIACIWRQIKEELCCYGCRHLYETSVLKQLWILILKCIYSGLWPLYDLFLVMWSVVGIALFVEYNQKWNDDRYIGEMNMILAWSIITCFGQMCGGPCLLHINVLNSTF